MAGKQKVAIVIDYQNVHMTAHDVFCDRLPVHEALIDPIRFARTIIRLKNEDARITRERKGLELPDSELGRIEVYRGLPSTDADPDGNRRNQKERSTWLKEAYLQHVDLDVTYRPLKYHYLYNNGSKRIDERFPPEEKGVDVLCALALTRLARSGQYDCVVLASRDTDLEPALEEAHGSGTKVEAAKWYWKDDLRTRGSLKVKGWELWTTSMGKDDFLASRDPNQYI